MRLQRALWRSYAGLTRLHPARRSSISPTAYPLNCVLRTTACCDAHEDRFSVTAHSAQSLVTHLLTHSLTYSPTHSLTHWRRIMVARQLLLSVCVRSAVVTTVGNGRTAFIQRHLAASQPRSLARSEQQQLQRASKQAARLRGGVE